MSLFSLLCEVSIRRAASSFGKEVKNEVRSRWTQLSSIVETSISARNNSSSRGQSAEKDSPSALPELVRSISSLFSEAASSSSARDPPETAEGLALQWRAVLSSEVLSSESVSGQSPSNKAAQGAPLAAADALGAGLAWMVVAALDREADISCARAAAAVTSASVELLSGGYLSARVRPPAAEAAAAKVFFASIRLAALLTATLSTPLSRAQEAILSRCIQLGYTCVGLLGSAGRELSGRIRKASSLALSRLSFPDGFSSCAKGAHVSSGVRIMLLSLPRGDAAPGARLVAEEAMEIAYAVSCRCARDAADRAGALFDLAGLEQQQQAAVVVVAARGEEGLSVLEECARSAQSTFSLLCAAMSVALPAAADTDKWIALAQRVIVDAITLCCLLPTSHSGGRSTAIDWPQWRREMSSLVPPHLQSALAGEVSVRIGGCAYLEHLGGGGGGAATDNRRVFREVRRFAEATRECMTGIFPPTDGAAEARVLEALALQAVTTVLMSVPAAAESVSATRRNQCGGREKEEAEEQALQDAARDTYHCVERALRVACSPPPLPSSTAVSVASAGAAPSRGSGRQAGGGAPSRTKAKPAAPSATAATAIPAQASIDRHSAAAGVVLLPLLVQWRAGSPGCAASQSSLEAHRFDEAGGTEPASAAAHTNRKPIACAASATGEELNAFLAGLAPLEQQPPRPSGAHGLLALSGLSRPLCSSLVALLRVAAASGHLHALPVLTGRLRDCLLLEEVSSKDAELDIAAFGKERGMLVTALCVAHTQCAFNGLILDESASSLEDVLGLLGVQQQEEELSWLHGISDFLALSTRLLSGRPEPSGGTSFGPRTAAARDMLVDSAAFTPETTSAEYALRSEAVCSNLRGLASISAHESEALCSWLALLVAKILMGVWAQHTAALAWAKKASILPCGSSDRRARDSGWQAFGDTSALLSAHLRFEGMLLIAEIYEQMGRVDRCMPYLADAMQVGSRCDALVGGEHFAAIHALHSARIWSRMQSSRLPQALSRLAQLAEPAGGDPNDGSGGLCGGRSGGEWLRAAAAMAAAALSPAEPSSSGRPLGATSSFRGLWRQLDLAPARPGIATCFHTALPPSCRSAITRIIGADAPLDAEQASAMLRELALLLDACADCFDVCRLLLRRAALLLGRGRPVPRAALLELTRTPGSQAWTAFAAVSSSCSTSVRAAADSSSSSVAGPVNPLLRPPIAEEQLSSRLSSFSLCLGAPAAGNDTSRHVSVHCLALEPVSGRLILSRHDSCGGPSTVLLPPSSASPQSLLNQWAELMDENVKQLTITLDSSSSVSGWSEKDKKAWWARRSKLDEDMSLFADSMQALLGAWRCMLVPQISEKTKRDVLCAVDRTELFQCATEGAKPSSGAASKQAGRSSSSSLNASLDISAAVGVVTAVLAGTQTAYLSAPLSRDEASSALAWYLQQAVLLAPDEADAAAARLVDEFSTLSSERADVDATQLGLGVENISLSEARAPVELAAVDYAQMTVAELKDILKEMKLSTTGKKSDLIARITAGVDSSSAATSASPEAKSIGIRHESGKRAEEKSKLNAAGDSETSSRTSVHRILILDEELQRLPWENIEVLRSCSCSRCPNLEVLYELLQRHSRAAEGAVKSVLSSIADSNRVENAAPLRRKEGTMKKPKGAKSALTEEESTIDGAAEYRPGCLRCWYCIDPDGNLPRTRDAINGFLGPLVSRLNWRGYVGKRPSDDTFR